MRIPNFSATFFCAQQNDRRNLRGLFRYTVPILLELFFRTVPRTIGSKHVGMIVR